MRSEIKQGGAKGDGAGGLRGRAGGAHGARSRGEPDWSGACVMWRMRDGRRGGEMGSECCGCD